jgi:hypothetical protein
MGFGHNHINLANGIGSSHSQHKLKSGSSIIVNARSIFDKVCFELPRAALLMLLLFIASIRVSRPMTLSGDTGWVSRL